MMDAKEALRLLHATLSKEDLLIHIARYRTMDRNYVKGL
jgi:hypothetical protein